MEAQWNWLITALSIKHLLGEIHILRIPCTETVDANWSLTRLVWNQTPYWKFTASTLGVLIWVLSGRRRDVLE